MTTAIMPFRFEHAGQEIDLVESCWINEQPHFTRRAIGEWLDYKDPVNAISHIVDRNSYIQQFSVVVKLSTTDGKAYDTEVYNPIGFQLIVFESRQPKAIEYKVAVAHLVEAYATGRLRQPEQRDKRLDWKIRRAIEFFEHVDQIEHGQRGNAWNALITEIGKSKTTVYRWYVNWRRYGHPSKRVARQRREARPETIVRDPADELVVQALRLAILARMTQRG